MRPGRVWEALDFAAHPLSGRKPHSYFDPIVRTPRIAQHPRTRVWLVTLPLWPELRRGGKRLGEKEHGALSAPGNSLPGYLNDCLLTTSPCSTTTGSRRQCAPIW